MPSKRFPLLLLLLSWFPAPSQAQEAQPLLPDMPIEREIAGGQTQTYAIRLRAGQFIRVVAVQKGINLALTLMAPDGKELWEANFSGIIGGQESLSYEAAADAEYRIVIRPLSDTAKKGIYQLELEVKAAATAEDKKRIKAERVLMEGLKSVRQSSYQPGIEKGLQALPLWRELGDAYWEADTLSLLGSAHNSIRKFDQAAEYYHQVLLLRRQIKDRAGESNALSDLGVVYSGLNKYDQSLAFSEQALEIKRELKDRAGEARVLHLAASAAFMLSRFDQVIGYSDQMLAIQVALGDKAGIGNSYNLRGNCYFNLGQYDEAVKNYEKAVESYREINHRAYESFVLHNLGLVKQQLGDYDAALEFYQKSLAIKRELKDRLNEGGTLSALGAVLTSTGEYEKALKYLDEALSIARELKDRPSEVSALINIGSLYQMLGQNELALKNSEAAVSMAESIKSPLLASKSYKNLAAISYRQGLYEKAVESEEKVLVIDRETKNRQAEIYDLINLASDYRNLGRYERALEHHEQALALSREIKSPTSEAYALANIGLVYTVQKNYQEAVGYHEKSLALFRDAKLRQQEGRSLINLGECFLKLGRPQESIELSNRALSLLRAIKDRDGEGITLSNIGAAYNASGQFGKAAESLSEALEIAREVKKPERLREVLNELARLERNQGNLTKASTYLEQSLNSLENSRSEIYSPQSRAAFLAAEQESLGLYTDLLMRRHRAEPNKGLDVLAVEVSERSRARVLLELLNEARINIRQDVDAALLAEEQALGKKVNIWAQRLEQATKPELVARLKLELSQLESEFERTQVAIRRASPQYAALTQPQPLRLREIQQQLDADTLLLQYSLGEERSYLWAITEDSLTSYELPKAEVIDRSARQVYELLQARSTIKRRETVAQQRQRLARADTQLAAAAQRLSQLVVAPVAAQLADKRLVIVADGALQYLPFAMLPEPAAGQNQPVVARYQPLIVKHEVVSLPSASALAIQRGELAGRQPAPKMLAVIADPVFDRTDARLTDTAKESSDQAPTQTRSFDDERSIVHLAEKSADPGNGTARRLVIPRLPFTRQEATQLLALAPKDATFGALDFQANRVTVLSPELSRYRYVHFATHGVLDSERPGLSSLLLSMVDAQGKPQDGFLRANDIYNLKLPAELVVLSACQTGLGKEIKGEGLVGLTRGFMYAGAARVVVSLWNVNDQATAELMTKFYRKMLKQGERPAAALRAAQVELQRQKQWQSPYFWAAFVMQGEWK